MTIEKMPNPDEGKGEGDRVDSRPREDSTLDIDDLLNEVDKILNANAEETDGEKYLKDGKSEKGNPKKD